jgi:hypothetical protein
MQVPGAHFFLTNPTNTPPRQHRLGKTFSAKNLSGSDSDTTYPIFFITYTLNIPATSLIVNTEESSLTRLIKTGKQFAVT